MTIIEKMARAICAKYGDDFDEQPRDLETLREWRRREGGNGQIRSHDPGLPTQADWLDMARAALEAIKTPSEGMIAEGESVVFEHRAAATDWSLQLTRGAWEAMIEAALKE